MYISIKKNNKEIIFSGLIFNKDKELEFTSVDVDFLKDYTFIFNEKKEMLELKSDLNGKAFIKLEKEQVGKLKKIREETYNNIVHLYQNILKGKEELLFLELNDKEFPYMLTSPSILNAKIRSPKYQDALLYVFSGKVLRKYKRKASFKFKNYEELQREIGKKIKRRNLKPNRKFEGQDVIGLKWNEIVN